MKFKQIDCFSINMIFFKILGIWPDLNISPFYKIYSNVFICIIVITYWFLYTINFYFLPRRIDIFVEQAIFYFTCVSISSKALTFFFQRKEMMKVLTTLESDIFQPTTEEGINIIKNAKKFNKTYWNFVALVSYSSYTTFTFPIIAHLLFKTDLVLPVCTYSFWSEDFIHQYIYYIYFYQMFGMHCHMLYNLHVDTFFLGVMVLIIAQLEVLDLNLRNLTSNLVPDASNTDKKLLWKMYDIFLHFEEVARYCQLVQKVFSITIFVQFTMASCVICVCSFRFTLPASAYYYFFLTTYMCVMIMQILAPCWVGTYIMDKSSRLSDAIFHCDWISRSKGFNSSLRIFVERVKRPLSIVGGKLFLLSLSTFTSIMNSAYSFFTVLRHMQLRED